MFYCGKRKPIKSRSLRERRAERPHPYTVPGWPAGLTEWYVFRRRELCPSFGLLFVYSKCESSLILKEIIRLSWHQTAWILVPAVYQSYLGNTSCPAPWLLVLWDVTQEKGRQWSHGKLSLCTVPQAGRSPPFPTPTLYTCFELAHCPGNTEWAPRFI